MFLDATELLFPYSAAFLHEIRHDGDTLSNHSICDNEPSKSTKFGFNHRHLCWSHHYRFQIRRNFRPWLKYVGEVQPTSCSPFGCSLGQYCSNCDKNDGVFEGVHHLMASCSCHFTHDSLDICLDILLQIPPYSSFGNPPSTSSIQGVGPEFFADPAHKRIHPVEGHSPLSACSKAEAFSFESSRSTSMNFCAMQWFSTSLATVLW